MSEFVDPEVNASFRTSSVGFVTRSSGGFVSCPPYVIASVARRRVVEGSELTLPDGYDNDVLAQTEALMGGVDQDVRVSHRQADELAQIGRQILALNEQGSVQPPLSYYEKQSVSHLVALVDRVSAQ